MYTDFSIQNFRNFDQKGTELEFRPITILTGCNNSGKSSITKALCLLKDFCRQIQEDYTEGKSLHLERYKMNFWKAPNSILGSFDNVLHHIPNKVKDDAMSVNENNDKRIVFEFVVESSWFLQNVILHLEFGSIAEDDLNNGYLRSFSVKTNEKTIYHTSIDGKSFMDLSTVKKSLLYFLYGQHAASTCQSYVSNADLFDREIHDKVPQIKEFDDIMDMIYEDLGPTAYILLEEWQLSHGKNDWKDGFYGAAGPVMKKVLDPSFVLNSPKLGVFCYYPCLNEFCGIEKKNVRQKIKDVIAVQDSPISSFEQKMIDLFIESFESSDAATLHDYISQEENKKILVHNPIPSIAIFNKDRFAFPIFIGIGFHWHEEESDLPDKADWEVVIRAMDLINQMVTHTKTEYTEYDWGNGCIVYKLHHGINHYIRSAIEDIFANLLPGEFIYSPTTIVQPKRLYSLEDTNDFSNTLVRYFEIKKIYHDVNPDSKFGHPEKKKYKENTFINKWLGRLDIARRVEIKSVAENSGATIRLYGKNDRKGMLLIDKGLGVSQLFAVLLKIENAILAMHINEKKNKYYTSGFSDSFVKLARTYSKTHPVTVALEEPEVHLHPRYQSLLADMIVEAYQKYGVHFIIETHSEYFIRKLQLLVADKDNELKPDDVSLNYLDRDENGISTNRRIGIKEDGSLDGTFGKGFYDEADSLAMELFRRKPILS